MCTITYALLFRILCGSLERLGALWVSWQFHELLVGFSELPGALWFSAAGCGSLKLSVACRGSGLSGSE